MKSFDYESPKTVAAAVALLAAPGKTVRALADLLDVPAEQLAQDSAATARRVYALDVDGGLGQQPGH